MVSTTSCYWDQWMDCAVLRMTCLSTIRGTMHDTLEIHKLAQKYPKIKLLGFRTSRVQNCGIQTWGKKRCPGPTKGPADGGQCHECCFCAVTRPWQILMPPDWLHMFASSVWSCLLLCSCLFCLLMYGNMNWFLNFGEPCIRWAQHVRYRLHLERTVNGNGPVPNVCGWATRPSRDDSVPVGKLGDHSHPGPSIWNTPHTSTQGIVWGYSKHVWGIGWIISIRMFYSDKWS